MTDGTIWVEFTSDWHVGTGAGRSGDVDRLIARETVRVDDSDPVEVPFLPAKTLTGILRDAAERLAFGLDRGTDQGPWSDYVRWMFGRADQRAALSIRPGHLSDALVVELSEDRTALEGLTTTRASTAIDPVTGTAAEHTLRTIEVGRPGTVFNAVWDLDDARAPTVTVKGEERAVDAARFLATAAALVDGIGAKRRRGLGRCVIEVWSERTSAAGESHPGDEEVKFSAARQREDLLRSARAAREDTDANAPDRGGNRTTPASSAMSRVALSVVADTKLLVGTTTFGNVVESSDYIPGRLLFPIVCGALRRSGFDPGALIAGGALRVGDANPVASENRLEPVPFALSRHKEPNKRNQTPVVSTVAGGQSEVQAKQVRSGYLDPSIRPSANDLLRISTVGMTVTTHNSIDDATQRPDESTGGVFTYEAIAAGQEFRAFVDLPHDAAEAIKNELGGSHKVGTAAKDDYGLVFVEVVDKPGSLDANETESTVRTTNLTDRLVVWCVSDVVIRNAQQSFDPTADGLATKLRAALRLDDRWTVESELVRMRTRRIEGFHRGWGLPQPTQVVVARGSCIVLTRNGVDSGNGQQPTAVPSEVWLGERCAEGYGRVLLNPDLLSSDSSDLFAGFESQPIVAGRPVTSTDADDPDPGKTESLLSIARSDALRTEILRRIALVKLREKKLAITGREPSSSAVGGLRRRLLEQDKHRNHPATAWFASAEKAFSPGSSWTNSIRTILKENEAIWKTLGLNDNSLTDTERADLWGFAVRGLIERIERERNSTSTSTDSSADRGDRDGGDGRRNGSHNGNDHGRG